MVGPPLAVNVDAACGGETPLTEREAKGRLRGPGYPDKTRKRLSPNYLAAKDSRSCESCGHGLNLIIRCADFSPRPSSF